MALPTPPSLDTPIPNPQPTIPNVAREYIVKGPYWNMKIADSGITVTDTGAIKRTGSSTTYSSAATALIGTDNGYFSIGQGMSVVNGNSFQVGTGSGTLPYYIETEQGKLILGNGFYVNSTTGNLELD
jgi:hypothetical protein